MFREQNGYEMEITDQILLYLSGKQLRRATESCDNNGLGRLAILIVSSFFLFLRWENKMYWE